MKKVLKLYRPRKYAVFSSQSYYKYKTKTRKTTASCLPHKVLHTELLGVQLTCLDPVPASIRARNAQEINITNCDVTTWSWVNLVHPVFGEGSAYIARGSHLYVSCTCRSVCDRDQNGINRSRPFYMTIKRTTLFRRCPKRQIAFQLSPRLRSALQVLQRVKQVYTY